MSMSAKSRMTLSMRSYSLSLPVARRRCVTIRNEVGRLSGGDEGKANKST